MRVGVISVFVDYHRKGRHHRLTVQPQVGALIAALLPRDIEIDVVNDACGDPDWSRSYDLVFLSSLHSDFDRARQISHYFRRRGAKAIYGGALASSYPELCRPFFDAVVVGDPESTVPRAYRDFCHDELQPLYVAGPYDPAAVPTPRFDLIAEQALPLQFEATRGCPFTCEFCVLTGLGTRFHTRPVESVVRDIRAGQAMLEDRVPRFKRNFVSFCDNNIGGNPAYLRELCVALEAMGLQWGAAATFNVASNPGLVRMMSRAGCRFLYVGLESFNQATLHDMGKRQNRVHKTREAIANCRNNGIAFVSGLMVSPTRDDTEYVRAIPDYLHDCGMHMPTFLCFESPIPGTPHFHRLANAGEPALLPGTLLRDLTGYTLAARPRLASPEEFLDAYLSTVAAVYSAGNRLRKVAADLPRFLLRGYWCPALLQAMDALASDFRPAPGRTFAAGTDLPPPEQVPLTEADFGSEEERRSIMEATLVCDREGRVLEAWRRPFALRTRV